MIAELKNFVSNKIPACKIPVVGDVMLDKYYFGGNVTLHPISAPRFRKGQVLLPRVLRYENFLREVCR